MNKINIVLVYGLLTLLIIYIVIKIISIKNSNVIAENFKNNYLFPCKSDYYYEIMNDNGKLRLLQYNKYKEDSVIKCGVKTKRGLNCPSGTQCLGSLHNYKKKCISWLDKSCECR